MANAGRKNFSIAVWFRQRKDRKRNREGERSITPAGLLGGKTCGERYLKFCAYD